MHTLQQVYQNNNFVPAACKLRYIPRFQLAYQNRYAEEITGAKRSCLETSEDREIVLEVK